MIRFILITGGVVENIVVGESDAQAILQGVADQVIVSDSSFPEPHIGDVFVSNSTPPAFTSPVPTPGEMAKVNLAAGFNVQPEGFTLPLDPASIANWTGLKVQLADAVEPSIGGMQPTDQSPIPLIDVVGVSHTLTILRTRQILFAGGNYYAAQIAALES